LPDNVLTNAATNSVPGFVEDLTLLRIPPWWQSPWVIALALVAMGALVFVGRKLYMRRRAKAGAVKPQHVPPDELPHIVALRRLAELRKKMATLPAYDFTIECSFILREYIGARFQLAIVYQTTREFLVSAQSNSALAAEHRAKLGEYLNFCDRVKFGREGMSAGEMKQLIDYAEAFVNSTSTTSGTVAEK
jgi:hypothetical protein